MFRNLRCYRLGSPWPDSEQDLSEALAENPFKPCGPFSERSAGWEPPGHDESGLLCRRIGGADLLQLRTQSRVLPPAAVREALEERVAGFRERTGDAPSRREMRDLKERTRDELMSRALLKSERTRGCVLPSEALLVVDAATPSKAEWFIDQLRPCFGEMACTPLGFNTPPETLLKRMFLGDVPGGFSLGRECRLQDPSDSRGIGAWRHVDLDDAALRQHVVDGMRLTHLGIGFGEYVTCVLGEDAVITKFRFEGDVGADALNEDDAQLSQDAEFVLLADTIRQLANELKQLLGGYAHSAPAAGQSD